MSYMEWYQRDIATLGEAEYCRYRALMTEEKRQRVDRFRHIEDRKRSVLAELLARQAVARRCGRPEAELVFAADARGKPYVEGLDIEISLSHAGALAVCAVSDRPVGIDVEQLVPVNLAAARHVFTPEEQAELLGHPPAPGELTDTEDPVLLDRFYRLWTQAEAYGKWSGAGIFTDTIPRRPREGFLTFRQGEYRIAIFQSPLPPVLQSAP